MNIQLQQAGKKYSGNWIFRNLNLTLPEGGTLAVLGPNGSGKSTLLQVLSGAVLLTEGKINYSSDHLPISEEDAFREVVIAAPYLELIEEFTIDECVRLHFGFKKIVRNYTPAEVIELSGLKHASNKPIRFFSSGMKQRLKLTLACLSDVPLLLLDEPCSNLDSEAIAWYADLIRVYGQQRTIVVCSNNQENEFFFCKHTININDYKKLPETVER